MNDFNLAELLERDKTKQPDTSLIRKLCSMLLKKNQVYKRIEIINKIHDYIKQELPDITIKKDVLTERTRKICEKNKKLFERDNQTDAQGYYKYIGPTVDDDTYQLQQEAENDAINDYIEAEQTYGNGEYTVYAWSLPMCRKNPNNEGYYPIKIGKTSRESRERFKDFEPNLPESPVLLIEFRCLDDIEASRLERFFHWVFVTWKINKTSGQEWFSTNPEKIVLAYKMFYLNTRAPNS